MGKQIHEMMHDKVLWKDITPGGEIQASGNAVNFITGEWRVDCPEFIEANCKQCLLCIPICPDSAIPVKDSKRGDFDFDHCKGCGICAKACPFGAIKMKGESN